MPILAKINRINNHASLSLISSAALTQLFSVLSSFNQQLQFLESSLFNLSVLYLVLITCSNLNFLKVLSSLAVLCNYVIFTWFLLLCIVIRAVLRKNIPYILILFKKESFKHSVLINLTVMKFISVVPEQGGARRATGRPPPPQYLSDQLHNPIRTGESRLSPPITTGPLNVFHLSASLVNTICVHTY